MTTERSSLQRVSRVLPVSTWRNRAPIVTGSTVAIAFDGEIPDAGLYGGTNTLEPGSGIPVHWHSIPEFQYILGGEGSAIDAAGIAVPVGPGACVYSPAGPEGAHGFENIGRVPLVILFLYPSPAGARPDFHLVDTETSRPRVRNDSHPLL